MLTRFFVQNFAYQLHAAITHHKPKNGERRTRVFEKTVKEGQFQVLR